jgi:hypothetical protein
LAGKCQNKRNAAPHQPQLWQKYFSILPNPSQRSDTYRSLSRASKMRARHWARLSNRMTKHAPQMPPIEKLFAIPFYGAAHRLLQLKQSVARACFKMEFIVSLGLFVIYFTALGLVYCE